MDKIELLNKYIGESNNIVFFGGAGVSTESGIKDFRSSDGLYNTKFNGYKPEFLLSHTCLINYPELFYDYYRENLNTLDKEPNITHKYLCELEKRNKLKCVITQNIDGLDKKAGTKNVLEIHGTIYKNYCNECLKEYPSDYIFKSKGIPKCKCNGLIRPNVILYEESLNEDFNKAIDYISKADLLIVAGTSLTVTPASYLINYFRGKHLVLINYSETPYDNYADLVINDKLGNVFSKLK